jgi:hypothetical protein
METRFIIIALIAGVFFTTSCTSLKRYKSAKKTETDSTLADINLFGFRLSQAKPELQIKSLWDLSADAQSQFLRILNSRYPDNGMFFNSLNYEYMSGQGETLSDDYTSRDLRLIFSVSKKRDYIKAGSFFRTGLSPADRIEYLKISLEIPEKTNLRFTGWNMYTTEYGSVDIGDVSFNRSLDLGASASLSAGKEPLKGTSSVEGKTSLSRREDQEVKYRYLKLNGSIGKKKIEMEEEGTREIDLTGNIIADVSLEFKKFPESLANIPWLKDSTGKFNDPEKLKIKWTDVVIPYLIKPEDTIKVVVKMDFIYRNVGRGRRTYQEWDDRIRYFSGSRQKEFPLFTRSDYIPHFYCIGTDCAGKELVKVKSADGKPEALKFRTNNEASAFYEWLKQYVNKEGNQDKLIRIGRDTLIFQSSDLTIGKFKSDSCFKIMLYY